MSQGSMSYVDELLDMSEDPSDESLESSEIARFFAGTNVLVTGSTGFVGTLLVEKLLRCCPDIRTMFLIVRPKKGNSPEERLNKQLEGKIFCRLKKECPNFRSKIVVVEGDASCERFGLSEESRKVLLSTNIIFHAAANVRFHETLRMVTNTNVRGTRDMLVFAKEMPNLMAFIYVSTAYSHCTLKHIEEKLYKPPFEPEKLLKLMEILDDEKLDIITNSIIGEWPNTYAFSKALAENLVQDYSVGIPTCIVRPSMVISTAEDPIPAWINNYYGPTGASMGFGLGLLRVLHCNTRIKAEVIPADYVTSEIIAAAWETGIRGRKIEATTADLSSDSDRIAVYNIVSSNQNPILWGDFMNYATSSTDRAASETMLWKHITILESNYMLFIVYAILLHQLPAAIVDAVLYLIGRKPILWKTYKKVNKFSSVISYFATQGWRFDNDNTAMLLSKMNAADRKIFAFDVKNIDWPEYLYNYTMGLRVYVIGDPLDTLESGKKKLRKLKIAHYTLVTTICLLMFWLIITFLLYLWSLCPLAN